MTVINKKGENPIIVKTHTEEYLEEVKMSGVLNSMMWILLSGVIILLTISFFLNHEFRAAIIEAINLLVK